MSDVLQGLIAKLKPPVFNPKARPASTNPFAVGKRHGTCRGQAGVAALADGWSTPEPDHTWSEGPRATIRIAISDEVRRARWVEIRLQGVIVPGSWTVQVRVASRRATTFHRPAAGTRAITMRLIVPRRALRHCGDELMVTLDFQDVLCPAEQGASSDTRRLSFGLQAFSLHTGLDARHPALLKDFIDHNRPSRIIALSHGGEASAIKLSEALARAGGNVPARMAAHLANPLSAAPRWVVDRRPSIRTPKARARDGLDLPTLMGAPGPPSNNKTLIITDGLELLRPITLALGTASPEQLEGLALYAMNADLDEFYHLHAADPRALDAMTAGKVVEFSDIGCLIGAGQATITPNAHCLMVATRRGDHMIFHTAGYCMSNSRVRLTADLVRDLSAPLAMDWRPTDRLWVQYDDFAHHDAPSIAYGRARAGFGQVRLVPDPYFLRSKGYADIRRRVNNEEAPAWETRKDAVFWRGSPTTHFKDAADNPIETLDQAPRIAMCLKLRHRQDCDVGIMAVWGDLKAVFPISDDDIMKYLQENGVYRPRASMWNHADYRFTIDIDGVSNAWSFFEKLLLGCCVLKVGSPFEQWFYTHIKPWVHYVPVRDDLSDLEEKIDWCMGHSADAAEIARNGQAFALSHDYDAAVEILLAEMKHNRLLLRSHDEPTTSDRTRPTAGSLQKRSG